MLDYVIFSLTNYEFELVSNTCIELLHLMHPTCAKVTEDGINASTFSANSTRKLPFFALLTIPVNPFDFNIPFQA